MTAHIRDASNVSHPVRTLHILERDLTVAPPQSTQQAHRLLNDAVSGTVPAAHVTDVVSNNVMTFGTHDLQLEG